MHFFLQWLEVFFVLFKFSVIIAPFGWGWLAGQSPHMGTIHMNQPTVLISHINEPATIRTSQPNRPHIKWPMETSVDDLLCYLHVRVHHTHHPHSHSSSIYPMHLSTQQFYQLHVSRIPRQQASWWIKPHVVRRWITAICLAFTTSRPMSAKWAILIVNMMVIPKIMMVYWYLSLWGMSLGNWPWQ